MDKVFKKLELPDKFLLLAHSYGCYLASLYASSHPQNVEALFCTGPVAFRLYDPSWDQDPYTVPIPNSFRRINPGLTDRQLVDLSFKEGKEKRAHYY